MFANVREWVSFDRVIPPQPNTVVESEINDPAVASPPPLDIEPEPISGFTCFIDYEGVTRRIVCRRFDLIGEIGYIGAICLSANGYRQFRTDRIQVVSDGLTGEVIGDGAYFFCFAPDTRRQKDDHWGLESSQKATLIAGLNVLAFMARCDGHWHALESEPIERFVCSMWLRKDWPGEPPLADIISHAQRLTPDAEIFFRGLAHYARSSTSIAVIRRAVGSLIEADGIVADTEFRWALQLDSFFDEFGERELRELTARAHESIVMVLR